MRRVAEISQNNYGRQDDFSAGCENLNINITSYGAITGDASVKHILITSSNVVMNTTKDITRLNIQANQIVVLNGTLFGVLVLAGGGCAGTLNNKTDETPDESISNQDTAPIKIFPNPNSGTLRILVPDYYTSSYHTQSLVLKLYNLFGQCITQFRINDVESAFDLSSYSDGPYLLRFYDSNGTCIKQDKLILKAN